MNWLKDKFNWLLGSIGLLFAIILFLKRDKKQQVLLESEKKILTNKAEIDIIEKDKTKVQEERAVLEEKFKDESKKVLDETDPNKVLDFFNNRLNK
jgi:hypothetical protein